MGEIKTKVSKRSVSAFLKSVKPQGKQADSFELLKLFEEATGEKAKLWGNNMIGFGTFHYESERSSQKGDWPLTAFSPRAQNLTVYIMPGFKEYGELMEKLGTFKTSVSCLYIKKLEDVNLGVLRRLVKLSVWDMRKRYKVSKK